jgi:phospholipid/cholesterol/gamma-HCH transport system substrate-binding protein
MLRKIAMLTAIALSSTSCAALGIAGGCDGTSLIAEFEQVGDLVENANVQSRDVEIGNIDKIELSEWTARVHMCIDKGEQIPADARAVVRTTSLLGEKFVDLTGGMQEGGPYLESGDIIPLARTGKATELEDVFARLATILGAGNLEDINTFTKSQREILEGNVGDMRNLLTDLRRFTDTLSSRRGDISSAIDSLDDVSTTVLADRQTLERFLGSFGESAEVLADQKEGLQDLLIALDDFSAISLRLLDATEEGINKQFDRLRPVLRTAVDNSDNIVKALQTLATYTEWFPESMPGDYLQLDICQAIPHEYNQGVTCPQNVTHDDPDLIPLPPLGQDDSEQGGSTGDTSANVTENAESAIEYILRRPLEVRD